MEPPDSSEKTQKRYAGSQSSPQVVQNSNGDSQQVQGGKPAQARQTFSSDIEHYQEPSYREHVSGALNWPPAVAPMHPTYPPQPQPYQQRPNGQAQPPQYAAGYQAPQLYPAYPQGQQPAYPQGQQFAPPYYPYGGYPPYYGYPPYALPYGWGPPKPRRDGYLLTISIISFIASILVLIGGLFCALILMLMAIVPQSPLLTADKVFSGVVLFTALATACLVGGSFSLYHSIRSLFLKRPSSPFRLPQFWIFLALYVLVAIIGAVLQAHNEAVANVPLSILLVALAGILPALTILALGARRVSDPKERRWPTSWRRFTLALVSGTTSAILFASIIELVLTAIVGRDLGVTGFSLDNPNQQIPGDFRTLTFMFILLSVIAPLVEETVKPLAVITMIGRIRSASEAFVLGLACGVGFDLIETSGYISQGYQNWLNVALERSTAGLLHGFGAAMVSLGWYILTHPKETRHRWLLGLGCIAYALIQHAVWNGTFVLSLLPDPIGPFFDHGKVPLGPLSFDAQLLPYIVLSILMICFFIFVTGRIRRHERGLPPTVEQQKQSAPQMNPIPTRAW